MPKKKSVRLPQVPGAAAPSPRGRGATGTRRVGWAPQNAGSEGAGDREDSPHFHGLSPQPSAAPVAPPPPPVLPAVSGAAANASQLLNTSLQASVSLTSGRGKASATSGAAGDWQVQSPEQILEDVKKCVQARKPWREELDDSLLDEKQRRQNERQDRLERGGHIVMPDNRVRTVEDEISSRVFAELTAGDTPDFIPPPPVRRADEGKPKGQRKKRNPWYLPAKHWFSLKDDSDDSNERSANFPYANVILKLPDMPKKEDGTAHGTDPTLALQLQKDPPGIVDAYKQYMKGNRLPHFLQ